MMRSKNKYAAWLVIFSLVFSIVGKAGLVFGAEQDIVTVGSVAEWMAFAENCSLDTWSQGKTVKLSADIDLSGSDFAGIPIFGGTFDGNGHTITGLNITESGSNQGLFRYIQKGGMVKNVTVKGNVVTSGTRKTLGGVVGKNAGMIKNVIFAGIVEGESYIGGIAGINEACGQIIESVSMGTVSGEHYIGGIAGENLGTILNSKNKMSVNTTVSESDITMESLENISVEQLNTTENTISITDIGGVTGFSTGIIQGCWNFGTVGYQHIGYNVGGIVGRQSGYISGCENQGEVYGRKDVGGIVGQMEPYISLEFSPDQVGDLQTELNKLQSLMNKAISDAGGYSSSVSTQLNTTKEYVDSAIDTTNAIVNQTENIYNDSVDSINDLSARVSDTLQKLVPIIAQAEEIGADMSVVAEQMQEALESAEVTSDEGKKVLASMQDAMDTLQTNIDAYNDAMDSISAAMNKLKDAVGDEDGMKEALRNLQNGFSDLSDSLEKISSGMKDISSGLSALKEWMKTDESWESLTEGFMEAGEAIGEMATASKQTIQALQGLMAALDSGEVQEALLDLQQAVGAFLNAVSHLKNALAAIDIDNVAGSDLETVNAELSEALNEINAATAAAQAALLHLQSAASNEESQKAREELQVALNNLSVAIQKAQTARSTISSAISKIRNSLKEGEASESIKKLTNGLESISEGISDMSSALSEIQSAIKVINDQVDSDKISSAIRKLSSVMEGLSDAADGTSSVVSDFNKIIAATEDTLKAGDVTLTKMIEVVKTMQQISVNTENMVSNIYDLVADLAAQPTITLPNLDSDYMSHTNQLSITLGDISNALGGLNETMSSYNELLLSDMQNVSNQFFVVTNMLIELSLNSEEEMDELSDYKADISDADTESNTQGKVAQCVNTAKVEGDINVGGISGSMAIEYDFDPEDDVTKVGNSSLKFQYLARAVIRECTNKGTVTSKKNYVGGIVGRMDLGTVISSIGYGQITTTDGDYAGGVAGASYSHIKNSFAMCVLSGDKYVGGITGYGSKLTENYAMVMISDATESKGAIAGNVESIESQSRNYFVNQGVAGIDEISYTGKAEPVSYETFCSSPRLPEAFKSMSLTFLADGQVVEEVPFTFGESIDAKDLPEVPKKEGYYGKWPEFDYTALTFSETLEAEYMPYTSVLASSMARDGKSLILVEGTFDDDAVVNVVEADVPMPSQAAEEAFVWQVSINGKDYSGEEYHELRMLRPEKGNVKVYNLQSDGMWKEMSTRKNGSYVIVTMKGENGTFCIDSVDYTKELLRVGAIVASIIGLLVYGIKRRKRIGKKD